MFFAKIFKAKELVIFETINHRTKPFWILAERSENNKNKYLLVYGEDILKAGDGFLDFNPVLLGRE